MADEREKKKQEYEDARREERRQAEQQRRQRDLARLERQGARQDERNRRQDERYQSNKGRWEQDEELRKSETPEETMNRRYAETQARQEGLSSEARETTQKGDAALTRGRRIQEDMRQRYGPRGIGQTASATRPPETPAPRSSQSAPRAGAGVRGGLTGSNRRQQQQTGQQTANAEAEVEAKRVSFLDLDFILCLIFAVLIDTLDIILELLFFLGITKIIGIILDILSIPIWFWVAKKTGDMTQAREQVNQTMRQRRQQRGKKLRSGRRPMSSGVQGRMFRRFGLRFLLELIPLVGLWPFLTRAVLGTLKG